MSGRGRERFVMSGTCLALHVVVVVLWSRGFVTILFWFYDCTFLCFVVAGRWWRCSTTLLVVVHNSAHYDDDPLVSFARLKKSEKSKIVCPTKKRESNQKTSSHFLALAARVVVWFISSLSRWGGVDFATVSYVVSGKYLEQFVVSCVKIRRDCTLHLLATFPGRICKKVG